MDRAELEAKEGKVWDTDELLRDFKVKSFLAPVVFVETKDGVEATLMFQHHPRFYYGLNLHP